MKVIKVKRLEILPLIMQIPSNDPDFTVSYTSGDTTITVVDPTMLEGYFVNFAEWYLLKPEADERTDFEYFRYMWNTYKRSRSENWQMLFRALFSTYDPLDNYNIYEDSDTTHTIGDRTFTHEPDGVKDTLTTTTESGTGTDKPTTEHYVATYNNAEKAFERSETSGKTTTTTETEIKSTYTDTTTKGDDTTEISLHRHGNAGVMTTAEVIRQESELRKKELAFDIVLGGFVDNMLFYSGAVIV